MKGLAILLLGLAASGLIVVGFALTASPTDDFDLGNPHWNGLSKFNSKIDPTPFSEIGSLVSEGANPSGSVLFLIGPSKAFTKAEASAIKGFLKYGGIVILMDDYGSGNGLLAELSVQAYFTGDSMRDTLFRGKDSRLVKITDFKASFSTLNVSSLILNCATTLSISTQVKESEVLAYSTRFSYLDKNSNGLPDEGEPEGPFPVIARIDYGNGTLILISDSSLFINGMIDEADNDMFLMNLVTYRQVLVDISHWELSRLTLFKAALAEAYSIVGASEVKYTLLAAFAVLAFKIRWTHGKERSELEEVSRVHPEWNRELLEKLDQLMRKYGVKQRKQA